MPRLLILASVICAICSPIWFYLNWFYSPTKAMNELGISSTYTSQGWFVSDRDYDKLSQYLVTNGWHDVNVEAVSTSGDRFGYVEFRSALWGIAYNSNGNSKQASLTYKFRLLDLMKSMF